MKDISQDWQDSAASCRAWTVSDQFLSHGKQMDKKTLTFFWLVYLAIDYTSFKPDQRIKHFKLSIAAVKILESPGTLFQWQAKKKN